MILYDYHEYQCHINIYCSIYSKYIASRRPISTHYYHYTNQTFAREWVSQRDSGRSREAIRPELKIFPWVREVTWSHSTRATNFSFSGSLVLDVTCSSSLTQLAMALAATTLSRFKREAGQYYIGNSRAYVRRPGDGKLTRFESRCCPRMLYIMWRFYTKRLHLVAFASEAA